jgi:hypothetical protein
MSTRIAARAAVGVAAGAIAAIVALATAGAFATAASAARQPKMPTPAQVANPANWTVTDSSTPVQQISPAEAYAEMSQAGAENTDVVAGLSLRQAVGLDAIPRTTARQLDGEAPLLANGLAAPGAGGVTNGVIPGYIPNDFNCWSSTVQRSWVFWPLEQTLADDAYWCGYKDWSITSFSHQVRQPTGWGSYCGPSRTSSLKVYGFWAGSPIREYNDYGTWNCQGTYQSHSYTAYASSSGAHWIG